jgi:hypothetical protein
VKTLSSPPTYNSLLLLHYAPKTAPKTHYDFNLLDEVYYNSLILGKLNFFSEKRFQDWAILLKEPMDLMKGAFVWLSISNGTATGAKMGGRKVDHHILIATSPDQPFQQQHRPFLLGSLLSSLHSPTSSHNESLLDIELEHPPHHVDINLI